MLTKAKNIKEGLVASYWFIPTLMSVTAMGAATCLALWLLERDDVR